MMSARNDSASHQDVCRTASARRPERALPSYFAGSGVSEPAPTQPRPSAQT
jgi:hypothetical protein